MCSQTLVLSNANPNLLEQSSSHGFARSFGKTDTLRSKRVRTACLVRDITVVLVQQQDVCVGYLRQLCASLQKKNESPIDSDFQNGKINDKRELIDFDDIDQARNFARQQGMLPPRQDTQENSSGPAEQTVSCAIIFLLHGIKLTLTFFFLAGNQQQFQASCTW